MEKWGYSDRIGMRADINYMNIDMRQVRIQEVCGYGAVHVIITSIIEPDCLSGGKILISLSSASYVISRIIWKSIKMILING